MLPGLERAAGGVAGWEEVILMELKEIVIRIVVRTLFLQLMYFLKQRAGSCNRRCLCAPPRSLGNQLSTDGGKWEMPALCTQPRACSLQSLLFPLQGFFSSSVCLLNGWPVGGIKREMSAFPLLTGHLPPALSWLQELCSSNQHQPRSRMLSANDQKL